MAAEAGAPAHPDKAPKRGPVKRFFRAPPPGTAAAARGRGAASALGNTFDIEADDGLLGLG
jgi:hypothetical protein